MRKLMKLGVSAVALVALAVAAIGAGSASATVLCRSAPSTHVCPAADLLAGPGRSTTVTATSSSAVLRTSGGLINPVVTCTSSTATITAGPGGGAGLALPGRLTGLTFTRCTSTNPTGCSASAIVTGLPTSGSLSWTTNWDGTITITAPDVEIDCPFLGTTVRCHYGGNAVTGTVRGGNPATVTFNGVRVNSTSGSPCPPTTSWTATYTVTSPNPMYVEDQ
jgi:hypothetical protein